jgi:hypothetical protein
MQLDAVIIRLGSYQWRKGDDGNLMVPLSRIDGVVGHDALIGLR